MNKFTLATALFGVLLLPACASWFHSTPAPASAPIVVVAPETRDSSQSSAAIKDIQTELQQQGYYHGKIDGVWGPATGDALRGYQQKQKLSETGRLNTETTKSLNDTKTAPDKAPAAKPADQQ